MSAVVEAPVQQEEVTFFCSMPGSDADHPFVPCAQTIVWGGGRDKDGHGNIYQRAGNEVRFSRLGVYRTADPGVIAHIRACAKNPSSGITEDKEVFYARTLPAVRQAERLKVQYEAALAEKNRLMEQLTKQSDAAKAR